ncbi:hypothetical protein BC781_101188 [Sediminitomix flava]|uniref:Outer membrane protein with beta-barrel domain n=1 Tax=Sediminitomix flava TaxID=379075 RepID=A0A315ZET8_SEDFL|nr:hypothetical protein BC781_101188 [Sediminitomix flava]
MIIKDFNLNSNINYSKYNTPLDIETSHNLAIGTGFQYNNKISIELSYETDRNLLITYQSWYTNFQTTSIKLGYRLF